MMFMTSRIYTLAWLGWARLVIAFYLSSGAGCIGLGADGLGVPWSLGDDMLRLGWYCTPGCLIHRRSEGYEYGYEYGHGRSVDGACI